jgi:hypothetical protein
MPAEEYPKLESMAPGRRSSGDRKWLTEHLSPLRRAGDLDPIRPLLHRWPIPMPQDWTERIHAAETEAELDAVRRSVERSQPFGSETWVPPGLQYGR